MLAALLANLPRPVSGAGDQQRFVDFGEWYAEQFGVEDIVEEIAEAVAENRPATRPARKLAAVVQKAPDLRPALAAFRREIRARHRDHVLHQARILAAEFEQIQREIFARRRRLDEEDAFIVISLTIH